MTLVDDELVGRFAALLKDLRLPTERLHDTSERILVRHCWNTCRNRNEMIKELCLRRERDESDGRRSKRPGITSVNTSRTLLLRLLEKHADHLPGYSKTAPLPLQITGREQQDLDTR